MFLFNQFNSVYQIRSKVTRKRLIGPRCVMPGSLHFGGKERCSEEKVAQYSPGDEDSIVMLLDVVIVLLGDVLWWPEILLPLAEALQGPVSMVTQGQIFLSAKTVNGRR